MSDLPLTADISGRRAARMLAGLQLDTGLPEPAAPFASTTEPVFSGTVTILDRVDIGNPSSVGSSFPFALKGIGYVEGAAGAFGWNFENLTTGNAATFTGMAADVYEFDSVAGLEIKVNTILKLTVSTQGVATAAFAANGATPQTPYALPADATDLPTAITLVNDIKAALIANGICS